MASTITPNMSLVVPTAGSQLGPQYALDINNDMSVIDQHDHSPGRGVQITPSGININTPLAFNNNFANSIAGLTLTAQVVTPTTNTIYQSGNDLYFVDGIGNNVRITQSGGVAGSPGSISNLNSPASAAYVSAAQTFVWQSNTSIAANMDFGSALFRNLSPNSTYALTLQPPSLTSNYTMTLPALPAGSLLMTLDASGVMGTSQATTSLIADSAVTTAKIADGAVTKVKQPAMASGTTVGAGGMASSQINSAVITTTTPTAMGLPITITTTGRPVMICLGANSINNVSRIQGDAKPFSSNQWSLYNITISRGSTVVFIGQIGDFNSINIASTATSSTSSSYNASTGVYDYPMSTSTSVNTQVTGGSTTRFQYPASIISTIDRPAAGTYTYTITGNIITAGFNMSLTVDADFIVYEL